MAVEKTIKLNVESTQAQKSLEKFGGTLEDLYGEGVQPLNFAIGELEDRLYEMAAAGQAGTKEFNEMAEEVGKMKKVIIDTDMLVDGMSQNLAQNLGGATMGIASGFELAQGSMAAFGVESAAVEETLLKVQSAMAISQGLQGLKESIGSFKALKVSLLSAATGQKALTAAQMLGAKAMKILNLVMSLNPVFLLVSGVAALTAAIMYFSTKSKSLAETMEEVNGIFEERIKLINETINKTRKLGQQQLELLQATGASEKELHEQRLKNLKAEEEGRKSQMKEIETQNKIRRQFLNEARKQGLDDLADEIKTELEANKAKYDELNAQHGDYTHKKKLEDIAYQKHLDEEAQKEKDRIDRENKEKLDKYKAYLEARRNAKERIEDEEFKVTLDREKQREIERQRELDAIDRDQALLDDEKQKLKQLKQKQYNQEDLETAVEFFEFRKVQTLEQERTIGDLVLQEHRAREEKKKQISIGQRKEDLENFIANQEFQLSMASEGFQALADLANVFAGDSEKAQKRAFNINKAAGIAQATIDTYLGAQKAYASQLIPGDPSSPIRAAVAAGIAVASGVARIAAIAKTKFEGGGSASASVGGSSSGGIGGGDSRPAEFNVVGNTGNNQLAQTLGSNPMKAYVVGADVTTQQSLDRNKIDTATL